VQRLVLGLNITVVTACLLGAGVLLVVKRTLDNKLVTPAAGAVTSVQPTAPSPVVVEPGSPTTISVPTGPTETFPDSDPAAVNFLVAGEPNNACISPNSPWFNADDSDRGEAELSDTVMVIRVDPATRQAAVLSFPRDLWVSVAGRGSKQRINTAYRRNDPTVLQQTIYDNFGIQTDHYIQVDFCAFKTIVDAVGGVEVPFDIPIRDQNVQLIIPQAGCHRFVGDEALAYVRSRKLQYQDENGEWRADNGNDFARVARQQDFIRRTLAAAAEAGAFNPAVARALIENLTNGFVVTDQNLTISKMLEFAGVLKDVDPAQLSTYQIASRGIVVRGGAQVLEPQLDGENMQAILAIFQGRAPLAGRPAVGSELIDPTETTVQAEPAPNTSDTTGSAPTITSAAPAPTTTVFVPDERLPNGIVPSKTQTC
jgi:LCP family protein required for cell wall assembly